MASINQAVAIQMEENDPHENNLRRRDNNNNKDSNTEQRDVEGWRSFAEDTTLHGARFLFADSFVRRLVWMVAVLACFVYCSYLAYTCVSEYYKRPFNTKLTRDIGGDGSELPFPAVTLCNPNVFNTRRFRRYYSSLYTDETMIERQIRDMSLMFMGSKEILRKEFRKRNPGLFRRQNVANKTKLDYISQLSHQIEEMLVPSSPQFRSCSINGMKCDADNFTSFFIPALGKCYTFNSAENGKPLLNATLAGKNSGLKLLLNIERDSYIPQKHNSVGLVVLIHDQKSLPIVEEFGITVQPGMSTFCAIKRRKVSEEKYPV